MKYLTKDLKHNWRTEMFHLIFEADTRRGKIFNIVLLILIVFSVIVVFLDSMPSLSSKYRSFFFILEWIITVLFTVEYVFRIIAVKKPSTYIFSFFGIVDLLAILPSYIALFVGGSHYLLIIRTLRLLRTFRILKLVRFLGASRYLIFSLQKSFYKIAVFFGVVLVLVTVFGGIMYLIEGEEHGFTSIPRSIYWAIVTLTTVGYGDITPITVAGQILASLIMILGYSIIAVPTGIIAAEISKQTENTNTHVCSQCGKSDHDDKAEFCKHCGNKL